MQNIHNKERILRVTEENGQITCKGRPISITPEFLRETMKARKVLGRCVAETKRLLIQVHTTMCSKALNYYQWKIGVFYDKTKFKKYLSINPVLQKVQERNLQPKEANYTHKITGNR